MALLSLPDFVAALHQSPLLSPEQKDQLLPLQQQFSDVKTFGEALIQQGILTPFQADRIVRDKQHELTLGRYLLIDRLGEGGAGQVFKAWDSEESRFVALKLLRAELIADPETVSRFTREISVSSRLEPHPNIIATFDSGQFGETHFLAMEFVEGIDLERLVKESGPLSVRQACEFVRQAALGLQHAHEHGLVHRDIKPSNLMVSGPEKGTIKLLDLGLARLHADLGGRENTFMTSDGSVTLGTVDYQAPEQALDFHTADIRADIYSLGCTLFYLLTGEPPFGNGPLAVKLMRHQQVEPPDLRGVRPDVPAGLVQIVGGMLAKDPAERYSTPGAVAAVLAEIGRPPRKRLPLLLFAAVGGVAISGLLLFVALSPSRSSAPPVVESANNVPPLVPKPKPPPDSVEATVPEAADYQLVYDLNMARLGHDIVYDVDRRTRITRPFDRIAYFVELRKPEGDMQYLYVSMGAFTPDPGKLGVPTVKSGASFQTNVTSMNVSSNVSGIVTGTGLTGGNIEFWPNNYGPGNAANVPNADPGKYDFGDRMTDPQDGHGCMQVHNHAAKQTLFALNKWKAGDRAELGIGNNPNGNPDWTFTETAGSYRVKRLRILVRCK